MAPAFSVGLHAVPVVASEFSVVLRDYPGVFLPFAWASRPLTGKRPVGFHDPVEGRACLDVGRPPDPGHLAIAERERLAEDLRLLYVAFHPRRHARAGGHQSHQHGQSGPAAQAAAPPSHSFSSA